MDLTAFLVAALVATGLAGVTGSYCTAIPARTVYCVFIFNGPITSSSLGSGIRFLGRARLDSLEPRALEATVGRLARTPPESLKAVGCQMSGTPRFTPIVYLTNDGDGFAVALDGRGRRLHAAVCALQDHQVRSSTGPRPVSSSETIVAEVALSGRDRFLAVVFPRDQEREDRDTTVSARIMADFRAAIQGLRWGRLLTLNAGDLPDSCGSCVATRPGKAAHRTSRGGSRP